MNIASIVGVGITAAAAAALLRRSGAEYAMLVSLAASAVILFAVVTSVTPLIDLIRELSDESGGESSHITVLMKALAVCVITKLASECCRDSGDGAIAAKIELAGKIAVLLVAVPLFEAILTLVKGLIL